MSSSRPLARGPSSFSATPELEDQHKDLFCCVFLLCRSAASVCPFCLEPSLVPFGNRVSVVLSNHGATDNPLLYTTTSISLQCPSTTSTVQALLLRKRTWRGSQGIHVCVMGTRLERSDSSGGCWLFWGPGSFLAVPKSSPSFMEEIVVPGFLCRGMAY